MAMAVTQIATAAAGSCGCSSSGPPRQADRHRHLLGRGRRPRRDHPGLGLRRPDRLARDRRSPPASSATGASPASSTCSATTTRSMRSASTASAASIGAMLTGVFAVEHYGGNSGLLEGNARQVINQINGVGHRHRLRRDRVAHHPEDHQGRDRPARHRRGRARRPRPRPARRGRAVSKTQDRPLRSASGAGDGHRDCANRLLPDTVGVETRHRPLRREASAHPGASHFLGRYAPHQSSLL